MAKGTKKASLADQIKALAEKIGPDAAKKAKELADQNPDLARLAAKIANQARKAGQDTGLTKAQQACFAVLVENGRQDAANEYRAKMLAENAARKQAKTNANKGKGKGQTQAA